MTSAEMRRAAEVLRSGGLVAFPTETVYGLGADASNSEAAARIFEVKNRPFFDPLIVHVGSLSHALKFAEFNATALQLARQFWPGPLTLVLPKKSGLADLVTSGLPTVGLRVPAHPAALDLLETSGLAVAAPSANPFGFLSPTTAEHVRTFLGNRVDMILDGGECSTGVESTILDVTGSVPVLLRPGGLALEAVRSFIGDVRSALMPQDRPSAPGQLDSHYAPRTPLEILSFDRIAADPRLSSAALLLARDPARALAAHAVEVLSPDGSLRRAAQNLFAAMHRLDQSGARIILAEPVREEGLGLAIMDRLRKASCRRAV